MTTADGVPRTDKHGRELGEYPNECEHGRLLGFVVSGNAAYATEERVVLATLDETGGLRTPPRERWLSGEFPLAAVELTPGDYVLYAADEAGPWRALTSLAEEAVRAREVDPAKVLRDEAATGDPAALVDRLTEDGVGAETSGELRQYVLDHPTHVEPHVGTLLDVVAEVADAEATDFERLAVARDLSFVLARVSRSSPEAFVPHLDRVLAALGDAPEDGEDHPHVSSLLDVLDVVGRAEPGTVATELCERLAGETDAAVRTLEAIYRLEHRYAHDEHPLLEDEPLRGAIEGALEADDPAVRAAAEQVDTIHGFHRGL